MEAALARFNAHYGPHSADRTRPYPGMVDLVTRLRQEGVRMAVYSNKADNFTRDLMARFFPGVFALVQGKREGVPVKPDPTGLRGILRALDADPARTLYVGDSATDIRTGHNAGLTVCAVTWGFRPRERLLEADRLADDAAALERVIREG